MLFFHKTYIFRRFSCFWTPPKIKTLGSMEIKIPHFYPSSVKHLHIKSENYFFFKKLKKSWKKTRPTWQRFSFLELFDPLPPAHKLFRLILGKRWIDKLPYFSLHFSFPHTFNSALLRYFKGSNNSWSQPDTIARDSFSSLVCINSSSSFSGRQIGCTWLENGTLLSRRIKATLFS